MYTLRHTYTYVSEYTDISKNIYVRLCIRIEVITYIDNYVSVMSDNKYHYCYIIIVVTLVIILITIIFKFYSCQDDWRARRAALLIASIICEGVRDPLYALLPQVSIFHHNLVFSNNENTFMRYNVNQFSNSTLHVVHS